MGENSYNYHKSDMKDRLVRVRNEGREDGNEIHMGPNREEKSESEQFNR